MPITLFDILNLMRRPIFQIVVGVVLIFAALTPLLECFDRWDGNVVPATDTELRAAQFFAFAGLALAVLQLALVISKHLSAEGPIRSDSAGRAIAAARNPSPEPTSSPPLIPLRI